MRIDGVIQDWVVQVHGYTGDPKRLVKYHVVREGTDWDRTAYTPEVIRAKLQEWEQMRIRYRHGRGWKQVDPHDFPILHAAIVNHKNQ